MLKKLALLLSLIFIACSSDKDNMPNETNTITDALIGRWEEALDQGSIYNRIIWTFSADGEMRLDFDDNDSAIGQWSALSSANRYSFSFQQYPDAAKRVFSLSLDFSSNKGKVTISDDGSTSHWVRNRVLNRME